MKKNSVLQNKWFVLLLLSASAGLIYQLPYLRYTFYDPMLNTFGYTNIQLGTLMSVYGIGSCICYVLGGFLADRFSSKYLISSGQVLTGLGGFLFATIPAYGVALAISFFWAFTTSLIFWPTLINYVRSLGTADEQGRMYGLLEGLRGIVSTAAGLVLVAVFHHFAAEAAGLKTVIILYAVINIVLGILAFFVIPYEKKEAVSESGEKASVVQSFVTALKMPEAWLVTIAIFATMTCFICLGYLTPYLTGVMGATAAFAATVGTIRTWGLQVVGGPTGGFIADKIHSSSLTMVFAFVIITAGFGVMAVMPGSPGFLMAATIFMFVFGAAIYVNRGVYFATLTEAGVPASMNGVVVGFASAVGFLPDAFMYTVIGNWLDNYEPATGYRMIFICGCVSALAGLLASALMYKNSRKKATAAGPD